MIRRRSRFIGIRRRILLAAAVLELFPETKLGHGPSTENGFFYDFYRPKLRSRRKISEKIEKKMQELVQQNSAVRARVSAPQRRVSRGSRAKATS